MDLKIIGKNIRKARLRKEMTQSELAEYVSLTPNYLSMLERGSHLPKLETLVKLAEALDTEPYELLKEPSAISADDAFTIAKLLNDLGTEQLYQVKHFIEKRL
ncbi:MAG: helix-turn-helix transcriptional regulator [Eubacterium sp.]